LKSIDREIFESGLKLPLVEEFYSIQGEGYHTGKAAYFIRIGGCDIGCHWCDSKMTWDPEIHPLADVRDIRQKVMETPARSIVVTGGEPSLYNLEPLCNEMKSIGVVTYLETAGTGDLTGNWDWICLSPKWQSPPKDEFCKKADELKVIVFRVEDIHWAEEAALSVRQECKLYLQPEWSRQDDIIKPIIEYVKSHPTWSISLQTHKYMKIP
jgi:organic radical activating enzyme